MSNLLKVLKHLPGKHNQLLHGLGKSSAGTSWSGGDKGWSWKKGALFLGMRLITPPPNLTKSLDSALMLTNSSGRSAVIQHDNGYTIIQDAAKGADKYNVHHIAKDGSVLATDMMEGMAVNRELRTKSNAHIIGVVDMGENDVWVAQHANEADVTVYKGVPLEVLDSIMNDGLHTGKAWAGRPKSVYFTTSKTDAVEYGKSLSVKNKKYGAMAVVEFNIPASHHNLVYQDLQDLSVYTPNYTNSFRIEQNIPKDWIKSADLYQFDKSTKTFNHITTRYKIIQNSDTCYSVVMIEN